MRRIEDVLRSLHNLGGEMSAPSRPDNPPRRRSATFEATNHGPHGNATAE